MFTFLVRGRDKLGANRYSIGAGSNRLRFMKIKGYFNELCGTDTREIGQEGDLRELGSPSCAWVHNVSLNKWAW